MSHGQRIIVPEPYSPPPVYARTTNTYRSSPTYSSRGPIGPMQTIQTIIGMIVFIVIIIILAKSGVLGAMAEVSAEDRERRERLKKQNIRNCYNDVTNNYVLRQLTFRTDMIASCRAAGIPYYSTNTYQEFKRRYGHI